MDLRSLVQQILVYENIQAPSVVAKVTVLESQDLTSILPLVGEEALNISFQTPSLNAANYNLIVTNIELSNTTDSGKVRIYTITGVTPTVLHDKTNVIQKSYNTNISNIVQDIYSSFLQGSLPLNTESTQGIQKIIIDNKRPFTAIHQVLQRASSEQNQSSAFVFFVNQYAYNFKTLESLFSQGAVANYSNDIVINNSIFNVTFRNIITYVVDQQFDSTMRVGGGALSSIVKSFDFMNFKFNSQTVQAAQGMIFGNSGQLNTPNFNAAAGNPGTSAFIPKDSGIPQTFIDQFIPNRKSYVSNMNTGRVKLKVLGDSTMAAGQVIFLNILQNVGTTDLSYAHPLISGNYMISKLAHCIVAPNQKPRYTMSIEAISGSYNQNP